MDTGNQFLGTERIGKLMRQYAVPCIISLLVGALYNIVDQIFIANASYLGSYGNAANTVVFPLTVVALAIAVMVGDGCCAFVSMALGRNEMEKAKRSVGNAVVLIVAGGLVLRAVYAVAQGRVLRDGHHRAVSPSGRQRGGSPHRDVPGRRLRAPREGHHGGAVGQQGLACHHQWAKQEGLRPYRGLVESPFAGRALSVRLRGRHLPAPQPGRRVRKCCCFVAIAVNEDGFREVLGTAEGMKENKAGWVSFFQWLRGRGLDGVKLIVGDKCMGMPETVGSNPATRTK